MTRLVNYDCRHFRGEVPCTFHKREGVVCEGCEYYEKVDFKVLIIKLAAVGDVLRTTFLLNGLKKKYSSSHITWITEPESIPLFYNNELVDRILEPSAATTALLSLEEFELVINLDTSVKGGILCELAKSTEKLGYGYNPRGYVFPQNQEAVDWFQMGLFDDLKKENIRTYQEIVADICRISVENQSPSYQLTQDEEAFRDEFAGQHGLESSSILIGINSGSGKRWESKRWRTDSFIELIQIISDNLKGATIVLYGGSEEVETYKYIKRHSPIPVVATGTNNSLREFAALLDLVDVLVTGDTLALHFGNALGKKVVALFGPTSSAEAYLTHGEKILPTQECQCYYKKQCDSKPNCMESISANLVFDAIRTLSDDNGTSSKSD